MREIDSCYFCSTSYQLFSTLSLAAERKEIADLYIVPRFSGSIQFAERIKKIGIFRSVEIINADKICGKYIRGGPGIINHIQIANSYLYVKNIAEIILLPGVKYNNLFCPSKMYFSRMVQLYYIKMKWDFNMYYFEDGIGTYWNSRAYQIKKPDELIRKFLFGKKSIDTGFKRFVFSSDIYRLLNTDNDNEVEEMQKFWADESGKNIMNYIFNTSDKMVINEKLIILDQPKDEILNLTDIKLINNLYRSLIKRVGFNNAIIKQHPRNAEKEIDQVKYFTEAGVPFEIYCMNMNMDEKIIVAYSSTAVATPKLLFNQEPKVIVLTKLFRPKTGEKNLFEDYFLAVKNSYSDPERFCIPENIEELKDIMKNKNIFS